MLLKYESNLLTKIKLYRFDDSKFTYEKSNTPSMFRDTEIIVLFFYLTSSDLVIMDR